MPSIVIVDEGMAKSLTTTTAKSDVYAFSFHQKGLMLGLGLQGAKICRIHPSKEPSGLPRQGARRGPALPAL